MMIRKVNNFDDYSMNQAADKILVPTPNRRHLAGGAIGALLNLFSSLWTGIFLAFLFFVYCTVGSAMPWVRQHPLLEMTEFEWFHWWPFAALVFLFVLTMTTITLRRIPFRVVNYGVWMIHTGIIILTLGSFYYFSTKIEGDAPVFRRQIRIELPSLDQPTTLVALPGSETSLRDETGVWRFRIQSTNTAWPILSDPHKGEKAYAVNVMVTTPRGESFIRQLLDGYPQYTEDIIPGKGRAIKAIGRKLVRQDLTLSYDYEPQPFFHVMKTWALYVRRAGDTDWHQRPIHGMPRYTDYIGARDQVFLAPHEQIPLRTLDLEVPAVEENDPLLGATVRITGYLRYAQHQSRWVEGGDQLNPVLHVQFITEGDRATTEELVAFDRKRRQDDRGLMEFIWLDDFSKVDSLPTESIAKLTVTVPGTDVSLEVSLTPSKIVGREGAFTPIEGTDLSYRIRNVIDHLVLSAGKGSVSVAMVDIKTPDGQFTRWVADPPHRTRDLTREGSDPHGSDSGMNEKLDPRIEMRYQPQSPPIIFAGYPQRNSTGTMASGLFLVVNGPEGRELGRDVELGEVVQVVAGLSLRADSLLTHAGLESKPFIVPKASRKNDAGELFSMIRLEVSHGQRQQVHWLPYNQYALPSAQYAYGGRFGYMPVPFQLADGSGVEVLFSRERRQLPNPVALDHFELDTHVGGYSGAVSTIRNYESRLKFLDQGKWSETRTIEVNAPTEYGGYWFFQSMWDKPQPNNPAGGMNYTGLGVGNRNGVYIQLMGCCLTVVGMIFAFYIKPILKRRRAEHQRNRIVENQEPLQPQLQPLETVVT